MPGFHDGGYEAARKAIEDQYRNSIRELSERVERLGPSQKAERDHLNEEIARYREALRKALASLEWCLF